MKSDSPEKEKEPKIHETRRKQQQQECRSASRDVTTITRLVRTFMPTGDASKFYFFFFLFMLFYLVENKATANVENSQAAGSSRGKHQENQNDRDSWQHVLSFTRNSRYSQKCLLLPNVQGSS